MIYLRYISLISGDKMNNIEIIIKALLEIHNLSQVDFALKSNIPLPTVKKYLQGAFNPTKKNIEKINNNFNVDISRLLKIDLKNLDKLEEIELFYKKILDNVSVKYEGLDDLSQLFNVNYNNIVSTYEGNFYEEYEEAKNEVSKLENTIFLISFFEKKIQNNKSISFENNNKISSEILKESDLNIIELFIKIGFNISIDKNKVNILNDNEKINISLSSKDFIFIAYLLKKDLVNNLKNYIKFYNNFTNNADTLKKTNEENTPTNEKDSE